MHNNILYIYIQIINTVYVYIYTYAVHVNSQENTIEQGSDPDGLNEERIVSWHVRKAPQRLLPFVARRPSALELPCIV